MKKVVLAFFAGAALVRTPLSLQALRAAEVVAWGSNSSGQTSVPAGLSNVVAVAAGYHHCLALRSNGTVVAWGANQYRQTSVPVSLTQAVAVAAGAYYSMALRSNGTVVAWGDNSYGQTNVPAGLSNVLAIAGGAYHALALRGDGSLVAWGRNDYDINQGRVPPGLSNIVAMASGSVHNLALRSDGTVAAWGNNTYGQTTVPADLSNVIGVAAAEIYSMALRGNGTVVAWGPNYRTSVPAGLSNVVAITAGYSHSLALRADGKLVAWGDNSYGQASVPPGLSNVVAVSAGYYHTVALAGLPQGMAAPQLVGPRFLIGTVGRPFCYRIMAKNGAVGYTAAGLPSGLVLDNGTGLITGQPAAAGTYLATVSATNAIGSDQWGVTFIINLPLPGIVSEFTWAALGSWFSHQIPTVNGPQLISASGLPPGLTIDPDLRISGTPVECGDFPVSVQCSNAYGITSGICTIRVAPVSAWGYGPYGLTAVPANLGNLVGLASSWQHALALRDDGTVAAWGSGMYGQTTVPAGLSNVVAVSAGYSHSLALRSNGTVVAWGGNSYGQTDVPARLSNVVAIAAGGHHNLALREDGSVVAWGLNNYGQATIPSGLSNVVAIAAGGYHSLAIRANRSVAFWGDPYGAAQMPVGLTNVVAVAAGEHSSVALLADGTVAGWGVYSPAPAELSNVVAVAAGGGAAPDHHNLALRADGTVVAWGGNYYKQSDVPPGLSNVVAVAAAWGTSLALSGLPQGLAAPQLVGPRILIGTVNHPFHHQVLAKNGPDRYDARDLPPGLELDPMTGVITGYPTQAGTYFVTLSATNASGAGQWTVKLSINLPLPGVASELVWAPFGSGFRYKIVRVNDAELLSVSGLPTGLTVDAASGVISGTPQELGDFPVSLLVSNRYGIASGALTMRVSPVAAWGNDASGQATVPAGLANVVAVAAGGSHSLVLRANGTLVAWGANGQGQATVPGGLTNVVAIAAGEQHNLALRADGTVAAWGYNVYGQTSVPANLSNVVAVAAGEHHSLALRADGTVAAWGANWNGQVTVPGALSNVIAIAAGFYHSLALRGDGTVAAWGSASAGQTDVPVGLSNVVAITAGFSHNLALRADGTVATWGSSSSGDGQANVPPGLSNVVSVAAGSYHNLALRADGTVAAWGDNSHGQTNLPAELSNVAAVAGGESHSLVLLGHGSPHIVSQPWGRTVNAGSTVVLSAQAVGILPLNYQWQHNGTNIPGATTASHVLNNIAPSNAGAYALTVANPLGMAISAAAYINLPPVAANSTAATIQNRPISIPVEKLLLLATDPNGDPVSLNGVNSTSTNGGSVALSGGVVTYTPATDYIGADRFSYTLSDGRGGTAAANVFVSVLTGNAQSQNLLAPLYTPGGLLVRFAGIVGRTYSVQRAPAVTGPWVTIGTATVGPTGIASFEDSSQLPGSAYYRTAYP